MWIVALALRRPYTFVVMALVIIILTPITILRTPIDIFPDIDIPVVSVVWFYTGMSPQDMAEPHRGQLRARHYDHGQRYRAHGIAVGIRTGRHQDFLPPGHERPRRDCADHCDLPDHCARIAARHDAAADHLLQRIDYADHSTGIEQQDAARTSNCSIWGKISCGIFWRPFRERPRHILTAARFAQIQVDLDLPKLQAYGLSPNDIVNAVNAQNIILPSGTIKSGRWNTTWR